VDKIKYRFMDIADESDAYRNGHAYGPAHKKNDPKSIPRIYGIGPENVAIPFFRIK
jgi:hypothetical protein